MFPGGPWVERQVWVCDSLWVWQQTGNDLPFPSAVKGFPFLFQVSEAAGFAAVATQVPN